MKTLVRHKKAGVNHQHLFETAYNKLRKAVDAENKQGIIEAMNLLENNAEFDFDKIEESDFEVWDELTSSAHDILYS